jgi:predicted ATPase
MFDSVASFLINASKANPIMLLLDDLHWADKPSLLLLQHLARRFKAAVSSWSAPIATSSSIGVTRFPRCSWS